MESMSMLVISSGDIVCARRIPVKRVSLGWCPNFGFLCAVSVLCVSVLYSALNHHRDAEDTEIAQRRNSKLGHYLLSGGVLPDYRLLIIIVLKLISSCRM